MSEEQQGPTISERIAGVMEAYGWEDKAEMMKSPEFKAAFQKTKSKILAVEELERPAFEQEALDGWFVSKDFKWEYDNVQKKRVPTEVGSKILFEDGSLRPVIDGINRADKQIEAGKDDKGNPKYKDNPNYATPFMTTVKAGPFMVRQNLLEGSQRITEIAEKPPKIELAEHNAEIPMLNFGDIAVRALTKSKNPRDRGCVKGKARGLVTATVTQDPESIVKNLKDEGGRFEVKEDHVKVILHDNTMDDEGNHTPLSSTIKIPLPVLKETYGLDRMADIEDIRDRIMGRSIAAYGTQGALSFIEYHENPEDEDVNSQWKDPQAVAERIAELEENGFIKREGELAFLDMAGAEADHVMVGKFEVYRAERNEQGVWRFEVPHEALNRPYWFDAIEHHYTVKNGPRAGEQGVNNEGAFIIFLDALEKPDPKVTAELDELLPDDLIAE